MSQAEVSVALDHQFLPFLHHAAEQSRPVMARILQAAIDTLSEQVNKTGEMLLRIDLEESAQALAKSRVMVEEHIAQAWLSGMQADLRQGQTGGARPALYESAHLELNPVTHRSAAVNLADLSLMDDNTMQARIDAARMQQAAVTGCERELNELDGLICAQMGLPNVQPQRNPLRPQVFIDALMQVLSQTGAPTKQRQTWMDQIRPRIGKELANIYHELTLGLTAQGVQQVGYAMATPVGGGGGWREADPAGAQVTAASAHQQLDAGAASAPAPIASGHGAIEHVMPTQRVTRSQLQRLVKRNGLAEMAAGSMMGAAPISSQAYLDSGLRLDDPSAFAQGHGDLQEPVASNEEAVADDSPEEIAEIAANVVALLVNNLIEDERLPVAIRQWIKDLTPTLQKLAEHDAAFLSDQQHAARRMLDEIMRRSMIFASEKSTGFAEFFGPIQEVSQPLCEHEAPDADLFERALGVMQAGWGLYEAIQQEAQEKIVKATIRREKRVQLAQRMSLALMRRDEMNGAPIFVKQFIVTTWAQVVADAGLDTDADFATQDTHSDNPRLKTSLQAMTDLAWSANPELASQDKPRLLKLIPALLKSLREGLMAVEQPESQLAGFFDELMKAHEKALKTPPKPGATPLASAAVPLALEGFEDILASSFLGSTHESPDDSAGVPLSATHAQAAGETDPSTDAPAPVLPAKQEIAKQLQLGAWVEFNPEANALPKRAQLTWMNQQVTLFMFIAPRGQATTMTLRALDKLVEAGKFRIVKDESLVSGALQSVVQKALHEAM